MKEYPEKTTRDNLAQLAVPKEFAEDLRSDFDGDNDFKRLRNWADSDREFERPASLGEVKELLSELKE